VVDEPGSKPLLANGRPDRLIPKGTTAKRTPDLSQRHLLRKRRLIMAKQLLAILLNITLVFATWPLESCKKPEQTQTQSQVGPQSQAPTTTYAVPTADQLYQLVASMALFPDNLVAQVLAAATYPDQVSAAQSKSEITKERDFNLLPEGQTLKDGKNQQGQPRNDSHQQRPTENPNTFLPCGAQAKLEPIKRTIPGKGEILCRRGAKFTH